MAKKRKDKRQTGPEPTKEEKAVATHVRFNCPTKQTTVAGDEVHYFVGRKAVDCLLESKWMLGKCKKGEPLFTSRATAALYLHTLLDKGLFWRARKLVPRAKAKEAARRPDDGKGTPRATRERRAADNAAREKGEKEDRNDEKENKEEDGKKKRKKVKLEFHPEQAFVDGADVYVWHFDPVTWTKFLIGLALVLASIALCLFPLWPSWTRQAVYYVSLAAMAFVGFLIFLIVLRGIVFGVAWLATRGKLHFWMLPNLTEDCGFFESFLPAYSYVRYDDRGNKREEKDSDGEEDGDEDEDDDKADDNADKDEDSGDKESDDDDKGHKSDGDDGDNVGDDDASGGDGNGTGHCDDEEQEPSCGQDADEHRPQLSRRARAPARRDSGGRGGFEFVNSDDM